jgi:glycosyltransferase involved in cell wall biosynthesis
MVFCDAAVSTKSAVTTTPAARGETVNSHSIKGHRMKSQQNTYVEVAMKELSMVSVIIPCRNEVRFIAECLDSLLDNGFPLERLEIIVVDGMSDDGTREIVHRYSSKFPVTLLDNPARVTPYALNAGIRSAKGDVIMRVDAHLVCQKDYITRCVSALSEYRADDVGGVWKIRPRQETLVGKAIAKAISHPFGVGNVRYRFAAPTSPVEVDTVPRKEVFERIGLFNEKLTRIQDQEFNGRLVKAGGKILLVPGVVSYYLVRSDLASFWRHNWADGVWSILAFAYSDVMPVRWRHLIPPAFATALIVSLVLAASGVLGWPLVLVSGSYAVGNLTASALITWKERDIRYLLVMPVIFSTLHLGRGLGSLFGVFRLAMQDRLTHAAQLVLKGSGPRSSARVNKPTF